MKTKSRFAVVTAAAAVALGTTVFASAQDPADAQQNQGAAGANSWPCPMDQNMMGQRMGQGMMGRNMMDAEMMDQSMMGQGMGSGMMKPLARDLTVSDVKRMMSSWLAWQGNANLKLGKVVMRDEYVIVAEIENKNGTSVQRYEVNRQTGWMRPAQPLKGE